MGGMTSDGGFAGYPSEEIARLRAEVARMRRERDEARSLIPSEGDGACDNCGVIPSHAIPTNLCDHCVDGLSRAEAAAVRLAKLEAERKIAHVQVDEAGNLWLHLDGGESCKVSVNVTAKLESGGCIVRGGVRQAAAALRSLLAPEPCATCGGSGAVPVQRMVTVADEDGEPCGEAVVEPQPCPDCRKDGAK